MEKSDPEGEVSRMTGEGSIGRLSSGTASYIRYDKASRVLYGVRRAAARPTCVAPTVESGNRGGRSPAR
jgi:hypothetical protein